MDWHGAIEYWTERAKRDVEDFFTQLIWHRLQLGHRTQDLLHTIQAAHSIENNAKNNDPTWQAAIKWLDYQRTHKPSLMTDLIWQQLESGNRTDELLELIRQQVQQIEIPNVPIVASPVIPIVEVKNDEPPTSNF